MTAIASHLKTAYPQALAKLVNLLGTLDLAEDFLQTAVEQALIRWQQELPVNPTAWLIKVAKNAYIDHYRRQQKQIPLANCNELEQSLQLDLSEQALAASYNDDLLRLIFTSCHPALKLDSQILLALKHVLGLTINQIAHAMVLKEANVQQKLLRAKRKISANGIGYQTPSQAEWPERLTAVMQTIYLLFNEGYFTSQQHSFIRLSLCSEAIRLARLLLACSQQDVNVMALLALLLHQDARRPARIDNSGNMVLLAEQDRSLWQKEKIAEANILLHKSIRATGRSYYGIQAAIAALHNNAASYQNTDWQQIYQLYQLLLSLDNSPVIQLNAAVALAQTGNDCEAIKKVQALAPALTNYRHYNTVLAGLYFDYGDYQQANKHYQIALEQVINASEQKFIQQRIQQCQ